MTRFDRRAMFATGAAAALLAATGASAMSRPRRGGRLRAALSAQRGESWDSAQPSHFLNVARHGVYEGLTELAADGTLRGSLATGWTSEQDGRIWRFALRPARWHDGSDVTAHQVAQALDAQVDGAQIVIALDQPDPALPLRLAGPGALIARADAPLLGTGLYALTRYEAGRRAILERVAGHPRAQVAGWADIVDLTGMADAGTRLEALALELADVVDHDGALPGFARIGDALAAPVIHAPAEIGTAFPLDNLRMAERWWVS